jgi:hypothetical protein
VCISLGHAAAAATLSLFSHPLLFLASQTSICYVRHGGTLTAAGLFFADLEACAATSTRRMAPNLSAGRAGWTIETACAAIESEPAPTA